MKLVKGKHARKEFYAKTQSSQREDAGNKNLAPGYKLPGANMTEKELAKSRLMLPAMATHVLD